MTDSERSSDEMENMKLAQPQRRHGRRALAAPLLLALALSGMMAGCGGPPQFTVSPTYDGKKRSEYFDRVLFGSNPGNAASNASFLRDKIVRLGDNQTDKLLSIITDAGGTCGKSGATYSCTINRSYVSGGCDRSGCSKYERSWQLRINWNASVQNFVPNVSATIALPKFISRDN